MKTMLQSEALYRTLCYPQIPSSPKIRKLGWLREVSRQANLGAQCSQPDPGEKEEGRGKRCWSQRHSE